MEGAAYVIDFEHGLTCAKLESLVPGAVTGVVVRPENGEATERIVGQAALSADGQDLLVSVDVMGRLDKHTWSWAMLKQKLSVRRD